MFHIEPLFSHAEDFVDGIAIAGKAGGLGFLDRNGRFFIDPKYSTALPFEGDLARVGTGSFLKTKGLHYINRKGVVVWEFQ